MPARASSAGGNPPVRGEDAEVRRRIRQQGGRGRACGGLESRRRTARPRGRARARAISTAAAAPATTRTSPPRARASAREILPGTRSMSPNVATTTPASSASRRREVDLLRRADADRAARSGDDAQRGGEERPRTIEMADKRYTRREFIRNLSLAAAAGMSLPLFSSCTKEEKEDFLQKHFKEMTPEEKKKVIAKLEAEVSPEIREEISDQHPGSAVPGTLWGYGLDLSRCIGCRKMRLCLCERK